MNSRDQRPVLGHRRAVSTSSYTESDLCNCSSGSHTPLSKTADAHTPQQGPCSCARADNSMRTKTSNLGHNTAAGEQRGHHGKAAIRSLFGGEFSTPWYLLIQDAYGQTAVKLSTPQFCANTCLPWETPCCAPCFFALPVRRVISSQHWKQLRCNNISNSGSCRCMT